MKGYVYILSNTHMPGLVKIGYTNRDVSLRARELSNNTGVPGYWTPIKSWKLSAAYQIEQKIFAALKENRISGEFFRFKPEEAVNALEGLMLGWGVIGKRTDSQDYSGLVRSRRIEHISRAKYEVSEEIERYRASLIEPYKLELSFFDSAYNEYNKSSAILRALRVNDISQSRLVLEGVAHLPKLVSLGRAISALCLLIMTRYEYINSDETREGRNFFEQTFRRAFSGRNWLPNDMTSSISHWGFDYLIELVFKEHSARIKKIIIDTPYIGDAIHKATGGIDPLSVLGYPSCINSARNLRGEVFNSELPEDGSAIRLDVFDDKHKYFINKFLNLEALPCKKISLQLSGGAHQTLFVPDDPFAAIVKNTSATLEPQTKNRENLSFVTAPANPQEVPHGWVFYEDSGILLCLKNNRRFSIYDFIIKDDGVELLTNSPVFISSGEIKWL